MTLYHVNKYIVVNADTSIYLEILKSKLSDYHIELIQSHKQLEPIYRLSNIGSFSINPDHPSYPKFFNKNDAEFLHTLFDHGILCKNQPKIAPTPSNTAFCISTYDKLMNPKRHHAERILNEKEPHLSSVSIIDNFFFEHVDNEVSHWAAQLPYRHIDVDTEAYPDQHHWVYYLSPPLTYVKSIPFLRVLDKYFREHQLKPGYKLIRAHIYSGSIDDIFTSHQDSELPDTLTVLYYPCAWQINWGGELIFYQDNEPFTAVAVKQGRVVYFYGHHEHRIATISRLAKRPRQSIVLRYSLVSS